MTMEKFWLELVNALSARGLTTSRSCCSIENDGSLHIAFKMPEDLKKGGRIDYHHLILRPAKDQKHCIDVEEIWTGRDSELSPWSDSMGCCRIECDGLNASQAVITVANAIVTHFNEYFA